MKEKTRRKSITRREFIVRAWISVSRIRCSRQGIGLKADTIPDKVVFLVEDSRFSV